MKHLENTQKLFFRCLVFLVFLRLNSKRSQLWILFSIFLKGFDSKKAFLEGFWWVSLAFCEIQETGS
uniref:Uncharacterized protein n=1 Tax=Helianthus annuus TaxID=4232 RepID=A0A251TES7_HELAN